MASGASVTEMVSTLEGCSPKPPPIRDSEAQEDGDGERGTFSGPYVGRVETEASLHPPPASRAR